MRVCGVTDIGRRRQENEDSYAVRELEGGGALLVVCDGMGGAQAGIVRSGDGTLPCFSHGTMV